MTTTTESNTRYGYQIVHSDLLLELPEARHCNKQIKLFSVHSVDSDGLPQTLTSYLKTQVGTVRYGMGCYGSNRRRRRRRRRRSTTWCSACDLFLDIFARWHLRVLDFAIVNPNPRSARLCILLWRWVPLCSSFHSRLSHCGWSRRKGTPRRRHYKSAQRNNYAPPPRWCWRSRRAAESRANWGCKMWINLGWRLFVGGREGFLETLETIFRQAKSPAAGRRWHIFRYTNAAVVLCGFYVLGLRYSLAKIWSKPF